MPSLYGYYYDWTIVLVLIPLVLSLWAQFKVNSAFNKYSKVGNYRGYTGAQVARDILDNNGLHHVAVENVRGHLSDHFDPRTNVVRLSDSVYSSTSVAAIGVAAHEVGHAIQYAKHFSPMKVRAAVIPATRIGSYAPYLVILGMILSINPLIYIGIAFFTLVVFFQLVTLPVEFDASARALKTLEGSRILDGKEIVGAKKVLTAAALTYVAAFITALLQLIRLLLLANRRRD